MVTAIVIALLFIAGATFLYCYKAKRNIVIELPEEEKLFRANHNTKEIHRLDSKYSQCFLNRMKNYDDIGRSQLRGYLKKGYNGCRFCMRRIDTDIYNMPDDLFNKRNKKE